MLDQITPVILTFNEEANIERTLSSLKWATSVIVLDSFSQDKTQAICNQFENVDFYKRVFMQHAEQWNHAINYAKSPWILTLDADHVVSDALRDEISVIQPSSSSATTAFQISFDYAMDGNILSASLYPPMTILFKRGSAYFVQDGHTQRLQLNEGKANVSSLNKKIIHDDRKSHQRWLNSQYKYAELEVQKMSSTPFKQLSLNDKIRRIPFAAPMLIPFYLLIYQGLWRDGASGLKYTKQRVVAETILQKKLWFR